MSSSSLCDSHHIWSLKRLTGLNISAYFAPQDNNKLLSNLQTLFVYAKYSRLLSPSQASMSRALSQPFNGHCACKTITYTLLAPPLITHCCHCTYCQRESGSAFGLNSVVEIYNFRITSSAKPTVTGVSSLSSPSGDKHLIAHCPKCLTVLYAHYGANRSLMFVKVGSLDDESREMVRPDVHIFTSTKMEWVNLGTEEERGVKVFEEYYPREEVWSQESLKRRERLLEWLEEKKRGEEDVGPKED
ncbi:uncharacterized protein K460DRAFT_370343 [Cucurbitaria berberidis CBS 394.84]|uniref:CENP-V/GFA domain-containing protein n=1 Tax=Cucurbitaria berberidis CBS 394.84 TaxID=1168544 RepID=A0A9P4L589_9PLEO|nr:uncharacterized protein K460DRAFT_370343 [Cucurbitaria berberidis CBS 394.84]KAF1842375.1 hypothetical protein K460DRAFT_370343 [Cucurbitaria berberidis CBS 394.84]